MAAPSAASNVSRFLDRTEEDIAAAGAQLQVVGEAPEGDEDAAQAGRENAPRVPFASSLRLTREQEDDLLEWAKTRLEELEDELGRTENGDANGPSAANSSGERKFLEKRKLYEMAYHNRMEWRPAVLGGIFKDTNLTVPIVRRVVRQMIARANNYFFGTDPWLSAYPVGKSDKPLADKVDRYTRHKLDEAKTKEAEQLAVELAFVRGECVVKTAYKKKEQIYKKDTKVLINPATGQPILDANGDFIEDTDLFIPETEMQIDQGTGTVAVDPQTGEPAGIPTGQMVLKRDGQTPLPENPVFARQLITRRLTQYEGPESASVYYRDFLCPLSAASVQDADCIAHLYDMPVGTLADMYRRRGVFTRPGEGADIEATRKAIELLRRLSTESGEAKAAKDQGREELGESNTAAERKTQSTAEIAELWLRRDVDDDGIEEEIMLIVDRKNNAPIFYDYTANITFNGERPFDVVRPAVIDGRWHGMGCFEMFESSQEIIDLLINRWNHSQSRAGRVDFWKPHNTVEGELNKSLPLNWGGTFTPKGDKKAEDCLEVVYLRDIKFEALQGMFEFFLQMVMNESGVQHANDANMVGLDSAKLATGIRNIEKSGQEMFALYLSHLEPGLTSIARRAMGFLFQHFNQAEVFTFFEGDVSHIIEIRPEDVQDLQLDISLLLTRYRGEQVLASSGQAANLVVQFYTYQFHVQERVAPMYRDMLKVLGVPNADEIIVPINVPQLPGQVPEVNTGALAEAAAPINPPRSEANL
ncbi:MAG: hypothetical protein IAE97_06300 [Chthoniobacterales bacterium]|nr:hypothetical protein [Chthoniobacterales bacterium]